MLFHHRLVTLAAGVAAALLFAAADIAVTAVPAHAAVGVNVEIGPNRAPPALRRERRGRAPHAGWAWQTGHWDWRDGRYDWVPGSWAEPPRARAHWVAGHWNHRGRRWVWVDGHWA